MTIESQILQVKQTLAAIEGEVVHSNNYTVAQDWLPQLDADITELKQLIDRGEVHEW